MLIRVRTSDGKKEALFSVARTTPVVELKEKVRDEMGVDIESQRLFFGGKQMENGFTLFDYDLNNNNVVQLMIRALLSPISSVNESNDTEEKSNKDTTDANESHKGLDSVESSSVSSEDESPAESLYFRVDDVVDFQPVGSGIWIEGTIIEIKRGSSDDKTEQDTSDKTENDASEETDTLRRSSEKTQNSDEESSEESEKAPGECSSEIKDGLNYVVRSLRIPPDEVDVPLKYVRPRANKLVPFEDVKEGQVLLVNYNLDEPKTRGHWYEFTVSNAEERTVRRKTVQEVRGQLKLEGSAKVDNATIVFCEELYEIPPLKKLTECTPEELEDRTVKELSRKYMAECSECNDDPDAKCDECGCEVCKGKEDPHLTIMCDECESAYHFKCLDPPLETVPDDEWYCPECKNDPDAIVKAGEQLKESKKKAKMPSKTTTKKNWGGGMACVGRTEECSIVPPDHLGPIPGVEVGTCWKFRVQLSNAGVHRPLVAGMHGRANSCAFSIVLSGGYEDDLDNGNEVLYTGSGGRNLEGNKRTAEQSEDQELTNTNKALAMNCNAKFSESGAESKNWKEGKPVRLVRSSKMRLKKKNKSIYAPEVGFRYDGLYKVVKYYPEKGMSGFIVWRYMLRRDDPSPAPWTEEGKKKMKRLGLEDCIYPEGYFEELEAREKEKALAKQKTKENTGKRKSGHSEEKHNDKTGEQKQRDISRKSRNSKGSKTIDDTEDTEGDNDSGNENKVKGKIFVKMNFFNKNKKFESSKDKVKDEEEEEDDDLEEGQSVRKGNRKSKDKRKSTEKTTTKDEIKKSRNSKGNRKKNESEESDVEKEVEVTSKNNSPNKSKRKSTETTNSEPKTKKLRGIKSSKIIDEDEEKEEIEKINKRKSASKEKGNKVIKTEVENKRKSRNSKAMADDSDEEENEKSIESDKDVEKEVKKTETEAKKKRGRKSKNDVMSDVGKENKNTEDESSAEIRNKGRRSSVKTTPQFKKRGRESDSSLTNINASPKKSPAVKKLNLSYEMDHKVAELIEKDINKKWWRQCESSLKKGGKAYLDSVAAIFECICCKLIVNKPVTLPCFHNVCKTCLLRTFSSEVYTCPVCRTHLGEDYEIEVNETLGKILVAFFPSYNRYRR